MERSGLHSIKFPPCPQAKGSNMGYPDQSYVSIPPAPPQKSISLDFCSQISVHCGFWHIHLKEDPLDFSLIYFPKSTRKSLQNSRGFTKTMPWVGMWKNSLQFAFKGKLILPTLTFWPILSRPKSTLKNCMSELLCFPFSFLPQSFLHKNPLFTAQSEQTSMWLFHGLPFAPIEL